MKAPVALALALLVLMAACGDDETERDDVFVADTLTETAHEPAAGMDRPPGGMGGTAPMQDLRGGSTGGDVTASNRGQQIELRVRLTGAQPGIEHQGHVHSGTCGAIGGVIQPLDPIATDSTGTGSMSTEVAITPADLMTGQRVVVYHGSDGRPLTCAELPRPVAAAESSTI